MWYDTLFLQDFSVWDSVSLSNAYESLLFSNSTVKRDHKLTDRAKELAKKCPHKYRCCWRTSVQRKDGGQPTTDPCFLKMASLIAPTANLSFHTVSGAARILCKSKWWINAAPHCVWITWCNKNKGHILPTPCVYVFDTIFTRNVRYIAIQH